MDIELRKVRYSKTLSGETSAFTADVYIDNAKQGTAENKGRGGPTIIHPASLVATLTLHAMTLPYEKSGTDEDAVSYPESPDTLVEAALTRWILARDLKRILSKTLAYTRTDKAGLFTLRAMSNEEKAKYTGSDSAKSIFKVKQWLNLLTFDEAMAIYVKEVPPE